MIIQKLIPGGQALTTLDNPTDPNHGKKLLLWNALPGETVESFELTKQKSSYLEGIATKIQNPSKHRTAPKDSCFLSTSPWQILDWDYELEQKRLLVTESLQQAHIDLAELKSRNIDIEPVKTDGKQRHYRNKMEYALYWDNTDQKIYLAFHARGTHRKTPLKPFLTSNNQKALPSSIERSEIAEKALKIVQELNFRHEEARKYQSLLLRCNQQGITEGGLLENGKTHPTFPNLTDKILGKTYSYSPNGFFQINLPVYELALKEIKTHIKTDQVLDLYAGVGTIGLSAAPDKTLTLVESNPSAFRELTKNLLQTELNNSFSDNKEKSRIFGEGNGRGRVGQMQAPDRGRVRLTDDKNQTDFSPSEKDVIKRGFLKAILAKSEDCLSFITPDQTVILDPPRAGCDQKLLEKLLETTPETIIYLSCNPSTQARDIAILTGTQKPSTNAKTTAEKPKYQITKISPYNFFPKTPHIENLIVLERL